jgi:hypothetical protein
MSTDERGRDERAILALLVAYSERMDAGDFDGVGRLFARATLRNSRDPATVVARGPEIADLLERTIRLHDGLPGEQHLTTNVIVTVDPDGRRATARSVYTVVMAAPELPLQVTGNGRYEDEFARDNDGWHFVDRLFVQELQGDQSAHTKS